MADLKTRIENLAATIRDKINLMVPRLIPPGGAAGQAFIKQSGANYDGAWQSLPVWLPGDIPAGAIDGTNAAFILAHAPVNNKAAIVHNGSRLLPSQYAIVGINLTLTFNPLADDNLLADYFWQ
jgi:hypothetical protein